MVPVPPDHQHDRETLSNPGGKWRWDNDEGWVAEVDPEIQASG
jgi:hypothetical protein